MAKSGRRSKRMDIVNIEIQDPSGSTLFGFVGDTRDVARQVSWYDGFQGLARWLPKNQEGIIGYIFSVEVPERLRGTGIGRRMVEAALKQMRDVRAHSVFLHAAPWTGGDRFAAALEFGPVDCCPHDGGFVVMAKDL